MKALVHEHAVAGVSVAGNFAYPGYVVKGADTALMIDCGLNILGPKYLADLGSILGPSRMLDYLFLTHSHYDHLGAAPYLKKKIPSLRLGGHHKIEGLMKKESVLKRMSELSEVQRMLFPGLEEDDTALGPVELEFRLKDGDSFDLGGLRCEVYAAPGHTADSMAYFIPELGALFPGEAIGVPEGRDGAGVQVEFLSSYDEYITTINKLSGLKPAAIFMAHAWVYTGDDARNFFRDSLDATGRYRELIARYLRESGGDVARAIGEMARVEYDEKGTIFQERNAYLMNLSAQVKLVAGLR